MTTWNTYPVVERDPNKVSGAWVFRGMREPVAALFENLRAGATIEQFMEWFPSGGNFHNYDREYCVGYEKNRYFTLGNCSRRSSNYW